MMTAFSILCFFFLSGFIPSSIAETLALSTSVHQGAGDSTLQIHQAENVIVNRIEFEGNEKTSDRVLRKALLLEEEKPFRQNLLKRSLQRLNRLNLFEEIGERDVTLKVRKVDDQLYVLIKVKERK